MDKQLMKFEKAFSLLRKGYKIRRNGWRREYTFLSLQRGKHSFPEGDEVHVPSTIRDCDTTLFDNTDVAKTILPCIKLTYNKTKELGLNDLMSIDLLSEDWYIVK